MNWILVGIAIAAAALWFVSSAGGKRKRATLVAKVAGGAKVIDVRSKAEYSGGHFEGAINIPVDTLPSKLKALGNKESAIVVYCASGARASQAASILKSAGFADVTNGGGLGSMPQR